MENLTILEKSLKIALEGHSGQKDKSGKPYILHPLRLMSKAGSEEEQITALLHDVVEDSAYTFDDLIIEGIPQNIIDSLECLTKREGEKYNSFISRILENKLAVKVKLLDIEDNINTLRLEKLTDEDLKRVAKYHKAWHILKSL